MKENNKVRTDKTWLEMKNNGAVCNIPRVVIRTVCRMLAMSRV